MANLRPSEKHFTSAVAEKVLTLKRYVMDIGWRILTRLTEPFIRTVENIKIFLAARFKHKLIMHLRLIFCRADVGKIQEHRERLNVGVALFGVRANRDYCQKKSRLTYIFKQASH